MNRLRSLGEDARRRVIVTVVLGASLLVMMRPTWHSLTHTVPDNLGDPPFTLATMDWVWHALVHSPRHLFDAPIFYPRDNSLAWSDPLLGLAPIYGVLLWLTGNRVLAWNLVELALVALALGATYSLARRLCGQTVPAVLAALAYGFSGFTFMQLTHVQIQMAALFPLMFLLALRLVERRTVRAALAFAGSVLFLVLSSLYLAAIAGLCLAVLVGWMLVARRRSLDRALWRSLLIAAALVAVPVGLLAVPYLELRDSPDYKERFFIPEATFRPVDLLTPASGTVVYPDLDLGATAYRWERTFFPGFITLGLAAVGTVVALRRRRRPSGEEVAVDGPSRPELWAVVAAGACAMVVAVGPRWGDVSMPMRVLTKLPGFDDVRAPSRLAVPGLLAIAVLAAVGGAWLARRVPRGSWVVGALCGLLLVELGTSLSRVELPMDASTTAVYRELSHRGDGAVLELPIINPNENGVTWAYVEASRMAWATMDDHPRLNGYSGSVPHRYDEALVAGAEFPANAAALRAGGVRYVVLHVGFDVDTPMLTEAEADAMVAALPAAARADRYGQDWLVDLEP